MRKASRITYTIGLFLSILVLAIFIGGAVMFFKISSPSYLEVIIQQIKEGKINTDFVGTVEEQAKMIQTTFNILAWTFVALAVPNVAALVFATISTKTNKSLFYILTIVCSVLGGFVLFILSAIFGLVANKQENEIEEVNVNY